MATASIPKTMQGVLAESTGGPEVLKWRTDIPVPTPEADEVLVKNEFIGVNYVDIYSRTGFLGMPRGRILGREAEGTIICTGSGNHRDLEVGNRVVWMAIGGYAEYTSVPETMVYKVPSAIQPGVAAAALLQGLTALLLIHEIYPVRNGDWVLIHAAAGGVGLLQCQLMKALGVKVIGTASTAEKLKIAKENGAEWVINYTEPGLVEKVLEITKGEGVQVVYDSIGKDQSENNIEVVAKGGTIVNNGASSGMGAPISPARLAAKNVKVMGPGDTALMNHLNSRQKFEKWCTMLFGLIVKGKLNVRIHDTYALSEAVRAHTDLQGRRTMGKVLMMP
ncbi:putative quinone oxidoreductase [Lachnellula suecica]|uniref:Probable quinone oxidoreductase n=1 Tax=Lachnellula suecica TaxID=602035 RepID=A0A8T9BWH5_9HELO|nr:putative quinone oxidoreductase [Lachnellula suecica]